MTEPGARPERVARLAVELNDEGVSLLEEGADLVQEEIAYARFIKVHEGIRPSYGVLIATGYSAPEGTRATSGDLDGLRPFADGRTSVLYRDIEARDSGALVVAGLPDELASLKLARASRGTLVQRHPDGTITVTTADEVWVNVLFDWQRRPAARGRLQDLIDLLKIDPTSYTLFADLLDFAFHQLSPRNIGATLVVSLQPGLEMEHLPLDHSGYPSPLALNLGTAVDRELLIGFLRVVDGASLISATGDLLRTQVKLHSEQETSRRIGGDRGMRHSSAKWFSYENPEVIVFVVSADGPVSVYSDGAKVAVFDSSAIDDLPNALNTVATQTGQIDDTWEVRHCDGCDRDLDVRVVRYAASDTQQPLRCPICGNDLELVHATGVWIRARKPWWD